jgi:hypothetical protein
VAFEEGAELVHVPQLCKRVAAHDRAAARCRGDESLFLEDPQGVAHRGAADLEPLSEHRLLEPLSGLQPSIEDR